MRRFATLGLVLTLLACAKGQNKAVSEPGKCGVRFAMYQLNPHVPGGIAPGMSKEQGRWYEKNKNKYPSICEDGEHPDYLLLWSSRFLSGGAPESTINFLSLSGYSGNGGVQGSGYAVSSPLESEYVYLSIFRAEDVNRAQKDRSYQPKPVYYTQHDSWWTYRKSHHKAMEDAIRFLVKINGTK